MATGVDAVDPASVTAAVAFTVALAVAPALAVALVVVVAAVMVVRVDTITANMLGVSPYSRLMLMAPVSV